MEALLVHCTALFSAHGGMFAAFFLGGLAGSLTHCLVMCAPMVACNGCVAAGGLQLRYHFGRVITYGGLGFVSSLLGRQIATLAFWPVFVGVMLALAGSLFIASSISVHRERVHRNSIVSGALMGFMPCGLVYAALMMAATLTNPVAGMVAMWLFALGTLPVLLMTGVSARALARKWRVPMQHIGRLGMALNGLVLLLLAVRVGV